MKAQPANLAASVHQRLLNQSKARGIDFNLLLTRFAIERLLYRPASSSYADQFVLKGAMMLQIWLPETGRPTRDLDLLGFGDLTADRLRQAFAVICDQPVEPDGVSFLADSVTVQAIRDQDEYGGQRMMLDGYLGPARLHVQVDVGIGDRLTPPAEWIEYPVLLELPRPRLRAYRPETTIAEKLHAMVLLDLQNSRIWYSPKVYLTYMPVSLTDTTLPRALADLTARDARLARIVAEFGPPSLWAREPGFATLLRIILEQQVSLASAKAAFDRLLAIASPLTPERFLELDDVTLKAAGFSRQKTRYGRELAAAILCGSLDLNALDALDDDAVRGELIKVVGIGRWTADIYLLMALRRPDAWPTGDLALAVAAQQALALPSVPSPAELEALGAPWRPWRAVAARVLWHYYLSHNAREDPEGTKSRARPRSATVAE